MSTNELLPVTLTQAQPISIDYTVGGRNEVGGSRKDPQVTQDQNPRAAAEEEVQLTGEDVKEVARFLNESARMFNVSLTFEINEDANRIVVSVINSETDEVVRQIPPQEVLDLASRLNEMVGVLFNETA
jgi:flagellar protein FlaG